MIYLILEHDDGAGQETIPETAPRGKGDRAKTPQGRAQNRAESCENTIRPLGVGSTERPGRNLPFVEERAKQW